MFDRAYWQNESTSEHAMEASKILLGMSMGFFAYDCILAASFDKSILTGERQRRWPQLAYFATKLCMLAYFVITLVINYTQHQIDCQLAFYMLEMLMGFTVVTSSVLLACRTIYVFEGAARSLVTITLGILACGLTAAWMQGVMAITGSWVPNGGFSFTDGACVFTALTDDYWVKYVCTIIFDAVVLFLTAFGIVQMSGSSHIGGVLVRQGMIYFVMTFVVNLLITLFTLFRLSPTISLLLSVPQTTVCVICACRLYVSLAKEARTDSMGLSAGGNNDPNAPSYGHRVARDGGGHSSGTSAQNNSVGRSSKSRLAKLFFGKDNSATQDAGIPSYFSTSSANHAPRTRHTTNATSSSHGTHGYATEFKQAQPHGQPPPVSVINVTGTRTASHQASNESMPSSSAQHVVDLEKQATPAARSIGQGSEFDQYFDSRSTADAAAYARRSEDNGDDEVEQSSSSEPQRTFGARVPARHSSTRASSTNASAPGARIYSSSSRPDTASSHVRNDVDSSDGIVELDSSRYVIVDSTAHVPVPSYRQSLASRPRTNTPIRSQQDDEVQRLFPSTRIARKDPPRK